MNVEHIIKTIRSYRLRFATETQLQEDLAKAFAAENIEVQRELILDQSNRIDLYIPSLKLGIECKIAGSPTAVLDQLIRYCKFAEIESLLLVTTRPQHRIPTPTLRGKPCQTVWVGGSSL